MGQNRGKVCGLVSFRDRKCGQAASVGAGCLSHPEGVRVFRHQIRKDEDQSTVIITIIFLKPFDYTCRKYVEVAVSAQIELHIFLCAEQFPEQFIQLFLYAVILDDPMSDHAYTVYLTKQSAYHFPLLCKMVHLNTKARKCHQRN